MRINGDIRSGAARLVITLLLALSSACALALRPTTLTCERQINPLGIDSMRPRLGWICEGSTSEERGVRQTAYRILVASSLEKIQNEQGDLWDTGRIDTDRSTSIVYRGNALTSGQRCWWRAQVWDGSGRSSGWSAVSTWTMGLLAASDWSAHWITAPSSLMKGEESPLLRKSFIIDRPVRRATIYVTGLGFYELHLNGKKVGNHELDPGFTAYDKRVLYAVYDVTDRLRQGANAFGVMLGNGWYNYAVSAAWDFDKAPWRDRPKLLLQAAVEFEDGTTRTLVSGNSWRAHPGPVIDNELMTGETYDARREVRGWDMPGLDEAGWEGVANASPPAGVLSSEAYPPVKVYQTIKPAAITEPKPGVFVYDFGQNMAGIEELTVQGHSGAVVKMQFGEELHPDGTLSQDKIKIHTHQEGFQTDLYTLKGAGTEVWRPRFTYHGFRYAQVTGFPGKPTLENLRAIVMHAGFATAGTFACSNPILNKIQDATQWAYISNFYSVPTDCPTREKNGWMGDAQLAAETGLYNYSSGLNYAKWVRDIQDSMRPSGELPGIVPTGGWGFAWGNGPAWDSAYVLIPWDLYLFTGDRRVLEEQYSGLKRYIDYVDARSPNHIAAFGLNDWAPYKTETPTEITSTGYFYRDTIIVAGIARLLNRRTEEAKYTRLAESIRDAFNRIYYHPATGMVGDGSQTALSCALYQGLAPDTERGIILANLVANIQSHGDHLDCGILGAKYIMHVLTDGGRQDVAYKLAVQNSMPSWGWWVTNGATTLLEQWNDKADGDLSRNHIMFGDISAWCYETLGGLQIDPAMPAFKHAIVHPHVGGAGDLQWVNCSHQSEYGDLVSNWSRTGNVFTLDLTIPANTFATVYIPARHMADVLESGKRADTAECVTPVGMEPGTAVFTVMSGRYRFTCDLAK